jgi:glycine cleavage system H protein
VEKYEIRDGLHYSRAHEWVKVEGNLVRVGVTDYAQKKLGDIVYAEMPEVGKQVKQIAEKKTREMELGALESIKAVSAVYSPISGTVKEVNKAIQERPELVNTSPYNEGWICVIDPTTLNTELGKLMDSKEYSDYLAKLG